MIRDGYERMGALIHKAEEVVVISEYTYGGLSPFVKNVFDRSISFVLPFFEIIILDLVNFYASVVTAIIFPIDWQSLVLFHFQLIVLFGSEVTAGTQFA